jgi:hypothetical protein
MHPEIRKNFTAKHLQPHKHCPDCNSYEMKFWKAIEGVGDEVDYWYCPNCEKYEPVKDTDERHSDR